MIENILGCDFFFHRDKVIGSGDFGTSVFEGQLSNENSSAIAVKRIIDHGFVSVDKEIIRKLIAPPRQKHPNIVQYFALKRDLDFWYLAMEKCDQTLGKFLRDNRDMLMSLKIDLAIQMSEGLAYLHRNQWCHKDIKPSNILVKIIDNSEKINVKLADVGLIKGISDSSSQLSSKLDYAAMAWMAPELCVTPFEFKKPSDIWAFGCVIYYSFTTGKHPFDNRAGRTLADRATNIIKNNINLSTLENQEFIDPEVNKELIFWIKKMISKEPTERPKSKEIVIFLRLLEEKIKNLTEKEVCIIDQLSKEDFNQMIGKIAYSDTKFLYRSSSSCVYLGSFTTDFNQRRIPCVIKIVAKDKIATCIDEIKRNEFNVLINLRKDLTQSIVQYYGFEENVDFWYIACERFEGNLIQFIKVEEPFNGTGSWPLQTLKEVIQQAAEGLTFVHHRSCTHKDIKPSSFVVRKGLETGEPKWVCKLTNFGLSKSIISEELYYCGTSKLFGTTEWVAPELLSYALASVAGFNNDKIKLPFTQKSDIWSFGCVVHFTFTKGSHPFGSDERERLENLSKDRPLKLGQEELGKISQPTFKVDILVGEMIQREVEKRPNMNNVVITIRNWRISEDRQVPGIETAPKKAKTNQDILE